VGETGRLTEREGEFLVKLARKTIEHHLGVSGATIKPVEWPRSFHQPRGVFVTLNSYPSGELRGCIGFPEPVYPLGEATMEAAKSASTGDPRFPPVRREELDSIVVEVSVLTPPKRLVVEKPVELPAHIKIGRHGLIVERGMRRGLLLPQVATEWSWDAEEFLTQTCMKAWLAPDAWLDSETRIYTFEAQVFREVAPRGKVVPLEH